MSTRGEHRAVYVDLWDDDDYLALSIQAKMVLRYLKDTGTAIGLRKYSMMKAALSLGCTRAELEAWLQELETPKPTKPLGWIVREGDLIWIVNGLRFEPTLAVANRKHREYVARLLSAFDEALPIVQRFRAHYAAWLVDHPAPAPGETAVSAPAPASASAPDAIGMASDTQSDAYPNPSEGVSKHTTSTSTATCTTTSTRPSDRASVRNLALVRDAAAGAAATADAADGPDGRTDGRRSVLTVAGAVRSLGVPPRADTLTPLGRAWRDTFLADATPERWAYVADEIDQALTPEGVSWESRRQRVILVHAEPDLLAAHLWTVLAEAAAVERPESAHLVALARIHRGEAPQHAPDGTPLTPVAEARAQERRAAAAARLEEQRAAAVDESRREEERRLTQGRREVARFQEQHPQECTALFQRAKREVGDGPMLGGEVARVQAIEALHIQLVQARAKELRAQPPEPRAAAAPAAGARA